MLSDFDVIYQAGEFAGRGTLVHSFNGRQLVLTAIPRETLEDYFQESGLTVEERALLVDRNLANFRPIISAKYEAKDFTTYEKDGQSYPLIVITLQDMQRSGLEFTNSVLEMARGASWVK